MSYNVRVVKVMIASPGDVQDERQAVRDIVHQWNSSHSEDTGLMLRDVGWDTDSVPEMGDRPQEFINKHLLAGCDLLVGMFWTRIGSPTGIAASGTVEEIQQHVAAGKPTMLYFSSAPVSMDSIDLMQYAALKQFRDECRKCGLVESYRTVHEFREKLSVQLARKLNQLYYHIYKNSRATRLTPGEVEQAAER